MRRLAFAFVAGLLACAPGLAQAAAAPAPAEGDWRSIDAANTLVIDTNQGRIIVELYPMVAPLTVARIETLAREHFYDGLSFFRVVDGFMDQTGDPKNNGQGGSDLPNLPPEFSFRHAPGEGVVDTAPIPEGEIGFIGAMPVASQPSAMAALTVDGKVDGSGIFCSGVIGMARAQTEDSGNSEFFLMRGDQFSLDQKYAAVGRVVVGEAVVRAIKVGDPVPAPQDVMQTVQVLGDMPAASRPNPRVLDTASAYFKAEVAHALANKKVDFNPCAVEVPTTGG
jgi:peptidylprolyl isomerase